MPNPSSSASIRRGNATSPSGPQPCCSGCGEWRRLCRPSAPGHVHWVASGTVLDARRRLWWRGSSTTDRRPRSPTSQRTPLRWSSRRGWARSRVGVQGDRHRPQLRRRDPSGRAGVRSTPSGQRPPSPMRVDGLRGAAARPETETVFASVGGLRSAVRVAGRPNRWPTSTCSDAVATPSRRQHHLRPRPLRRRDRLPRRRLHRAPPEPHRRRVDDVRAGELEHCRHKDLQRRLRLRRRCPADSLFGMIRHTEAVSGQHTVVAYSDNSPSWRGSATAGHRRRPVPRARTPGTWTSPRADEGRDPQHPTAISPFPGCSDGLRRRRSATRAQLDAARSPRPA